MSMGSACQRSPPTWTEPFTPPRRCSSGPDPLSARPTKRRRAAMTDPFDALRSPSRPVQPDPDFAAELRDNLRRLILNGETVSTRTDTTTEAPVQAQLRSLTPYLAVSDARAAMDFY